MDGVGESLRFGAQRMWRWLAVVLLAAAGTAQAVDIQLSQFVDDPDPATRGGTFTYTINVENNAADTANNVVMTLPLPATTQFVSVTTGMGCAHDGNTPGTVSCSLGNLLGSMAGGPVKSVNVVVRTTAATGATVVATASVTASNEGANTGNNSLTQNSTIDDGADLVLTKTATPIPPATVVAGATASFTLALNNAGPNDSGVVTVEDTLPTNMTYVSASGTGWSCGVAGQLVTCTRAALANGAAAADITVVGRVTGAVTGTLTNSATVSSTVKDPDPNNNTRTANILVTQGADLGVTKTVSPSPVISGQTATFTITPVNNGPFTSTTVTLTDTLPVGFTYLSASGSGWTCSPVTPTCTRTSFAVGASVPITLTATAPVVVTSTSYTNHVAISSADVADPAAGNNQYSLNFSVAPDGVDLSVVKTKTPNPVAENANMTSTLRVTNNGPNNAAAGKVEVIDTLAVGETYVSGSGTNWTCVNSGASPDEVTCTYSQALANGVSTPDLTITTRADAAGVLANTACARYTGGAPGDGVVDNDCQTRSVNSTAAAQAVDLTISKSAAAPAGGDTILTDAESSITYTITVTNNGGPGDATGVVMTDTIPGYVSGTGVTASKTGGTSTATFTCTTGSTVNCTQSGGTIGVGETAIFTVVVTRPLGDGDPLTNTATVTSTNQGDSDPTNNSASANVTVQPIADVEMQSKIVTPATVKAGVNATYVLTFRNNGPSAAAGVSVADRFTVPGGDAGFTLISFSSNKAGSSCAGMTAGTSYGPGTPTLNCTIGTLASGESQTITLVVRPNWQAGQVGNRSLTNTAAIATTTPESVSNVTDNGNNSKNATLTIQPAEVDVLVNKTDLAPAGPDPLGYDPFIPANNVITYKVRLSNRGPSLATGVSFTDAMTPPAGKTITFLGDDDSLGAVDGDICNNVGVTSGAGTPLNLTCTLPAPGELAANAFVDRYLRFRVNEAPAPGGSIFSNTATVVRNESDSNAGNDSVTETTTVRALVDLRLVKTASLDPVQLRQPFSWILTVTNLGPGDSGQTTVSDTLPAGVEFFGAAPSWSKSGGGSGTCATSGQNLSCNFGQVNSGQVVTVTVPVRVTAYTATKQNCATASTSEVDNVSGNSTNQCHTVTVQRSSLAGFVYHDADDDGSKGGAETGIDGVNVRLTGTDDYGNPVDTTIATAGGGAFSFTDLSPGTYTLTEPTQPAGYVDGLDAKAGVVIPGSKLTDTITNIVLPGNTSGTGYLFGERVEAGISGFVWFDANNDGIKDAGENIGISGVSIRLTGTDDLGQAVDRTTTTLANGSYAFVSVRPGTYTLTETHPSAWVDGKDKAGTGATAAGTAGNDTITGIVLSLYGQTAINYNFGELGGSLAGSVYHDGNNDGIRQPEEVGIAGVTLTLTGTDANGQPVSRNATTGADGRYTFPGLPVPNGAGYILTEYTPPNAPAGFTDGADKVGSLGGVLGNDVITAISFPAAGANGTGYDFGERTAAKTSIAGRVWLDKNGNASFDGNDKVLSNWIVELVPNDTRDHANATVLASTRTGTNGTYLFPDVTVGAIYEIRFRDPATQAIFGKPQDDNGVQVATQTDYTTLRITPVASTPIDHMNLPVDPSGVVYDALTRQPLAGATVFLDTDPAVACAPVAFNSAVHLIGGTPAATQVTGADGLYQFLLTHDAPTCRYRVRVTGYPSGYIPAESAYIPRCTNTLNVVGAAPPALVQPTNDPSTAAAHNPATCAATTDGTFVAGSVPDTTRYYQTFDMSGSTTLPGKSRGVIHNHIPLDPYSTGLIIVTKTTPLLNVSKGDLVPYTVTFTNTLSSAVPNIELKDQIPPGFKYKPGSASLGGCTGTPPQATNEPAVAGRDLSWGAQTFTARECKRVKLLLVVGAGVSEGEYTNQAWARHALIGRTVSNIATATVRIVPDPVFDCSDLIGKVFDDRNANGYQDEGEPGIPNVRVATVNGLLVTTDKEGRFHVACAQIPQAERGSNFIMKLDERSLPSGYRVTTENPRVVRMTRGKLNKLNFGATIHRVIRLELSDAAFEAGQAVPGPALATALDGLQETLRAKPSILRLAYQAGGEGDDLAKVRLRTLRQRIEEKWKARDDGYTLVFEEEIFERAALKKGGVK